MAASTAPTTTSAVPMAAGALAIMGRAACAATSTGGASDGAHAPSYGCWRCAAPRTVRPAAAGIVWCTGWADAMCVTCGRVAYAWGMAAPGGIADGAIMRGWAGMIGEATGRAGDAAIVGVSGTCESTGDGIGCAAAMGGVDVRGLDRAGCTCEGFFAIGCAMCCGMADATACGAT